MARLGALLEDLGTAHHIKRLKLSIFGRLSKCYYDLENIRWHIPLESLQSYVCNFSEAANGN
jgi:hypothetical protein